MTPAEFLHSASHRSLQSFEHSTDDSNYREHLLERFSLIHDQIQCEHSPGEAFMLANEVLILDAGGPVVECGAYQGGLTAKLSIICRAAGRELYVCDSFAGLPSPQIHSGLYDHYEERSDVVAKFGQSCQFTQGQYACSLYDLVQNVTRTGCIEVCRLAVGRFKDTLPLLDIRPSLVMMDVDLIESGRSCLKYLWPRLRGRKFFTHEAFNRTYMEGILKPDWWRRTFRCDPPTVRGNVHGVNPHATCLAYLEKKT